SRAGFYRADPIASMKRLAQERCIGGRKLLAYGIPIVAIETGLRITGRARKIRPENLRGRQE
ncbi:hypothetical protein ACMWP8_28915, partial [Escherichia coli]|uniref:hypothetical protein n=1 Tax=Escherichia coli TaxID=562 RepID=UPI0039E080E4